MPCFARSAAVGTVKSADVSAVTPRRTPLPMASPAVVSVGSIQSGSSRSPSFFTSWMKPVTAPTPSVRSRRNVSIAGLTTSPTSIASVDIVDLRPSTAPISPCIFAVASSFAAPFRLAVSVASWRPSEPFAKMMPAARIASDPKIAVSAACC